MYSHTRVDSKSRDARLVASDNARVGTDKRPVAVRVQSEERKQEVAALCKENGWVYDIQIDAEQPEDTAELELLQNPIEQVRIEKSVKRNDPCPCGSGKKYKKCHG